MAAGLAFLVGHLEEEYTAQGPGRGDMDGLWPKVIYGERTQE